MHKAYATIIALFLLLTSTARAVKPSSQPKLKYLSQVSENIRNKRVTLNNKFQEAKDNKNNHILVEYRDGNRIERYNEEINNTLINEIEENRNITNAGLQFLENIANRVGYTLDSSKELSSLFDSMCSDIEKIEPDTTFNWTGLNVDEDESYKKVLACKFITMARSKLQDFRRNYKTIKNQNITNLQKETDERLDDLLVELSSNADNSSEFETFSSLLSQNFIKIFSEITATKELVRKI